uniref:Uncharacterized protein n=1 Tax=Rhizophora mucronata TaxID=61149 RepID=A0A2P2PPS9_RHIMU
MKTHRRKKETKYLDPYAKT